MMDLFRHVTPNVSGHGLAEIEAALDGVYQHIAIGKKNDAHINEENCENERPHLGDAAQWENGPR